MLIAHQLKQQNMVEYVLYLWQIEDLIRAFNFDMAQIEANIITPYPCNEEQKKDMRGWYESLIDMMSREGVKQAGHIQLIRNSVSQLEELHQNLLQSEQNTAYKAKFYYLLPSLTFLKSKNTTPGSVGDVEMGLVFLYGIMTLKRQHRDITPDTQRTYEEVRKWMILLARAFNEEEE